jgi:hypothetical protein
MLMELEALTDRPVFTVNSEGLHCSAKGVANFSVVQEYQSTSIPDYPWVFALDVEMDAGLDIIIHKNSTTGESSIVLQIDELKVNFTGKYQTQVGPVDVTSLDVLSTAVLSVARLLINVILSGGLPIPVLTGFDLSNPAIVYSNDQWGDDFFAIGADIVYNP